MKTFKNKNQQIAQILFTEGLAAQDKDQLKIAAAAYKETLQFDPEHLEALYNLAILNHDQGNLEKALQGYQKVVTLQPNLAAAHKNIGDTLFALEQIDAAAIAYKKAVELEPELVGSWYNLGLLEKHRQKFNDAAIAWRHALSLRPDYVAASRALAKLSRQQGDFQKALSLYHKLLQSYPQDRRIKLELAIIYQVTGELGRAQDFCSNILNDHPDDPETLNILGLIYLQRGEPQQAIRCLRRAVTKKPELMRIHTNLLYAMLTDPATPPADYLNETRHWWLSHGLPASKSTSYSHDRPRLPGRKLRLGFISADLKRHSVSYFLLPLLEYLRKMDFLIYCYADLPQFDAYSRRIQQKIDYWRPVFALKDIDVGHMIEDDKIDILIELGGHTANNRLTLMAQKPAPVQISWLGYPASTGLDNGTFRLSDTIVDPVGSEIFYSEPLLRLPPPFLCYAPPREVIDLQPVGKKNMRPLTFGSFNNPAKINHPVISMWAKILHQLPDSRLLLKDKIFRDQETRKKFRQRFSEMGIAAKRVDLHPGNPDLSNHFKSYQKIDIALDTFPYNGTTTTCEALWMGIPVITLQGSTHAARVGADLLMAIDCPELVATDINNYVKLAVNLALNQKQQVYYHENLRRYLQNSSLMKAENFAENFADILRKCWFNWQKSCNNTKKYNNPKSQALEENSLSYFTQACAFHNAGDLSKAITLYEMILSENPQRFDAAINLSRVYKLKDELDKARKVLEEAITYNPNEAELYFQFATIQHRLRQPKSARQALLHCLRLNPQDARAWSNLGYLQQDDGLEDEAVIAFKQALKIDPEQPETVANLLWHIVQGCSWEEAAIWQKKLDYLDSLALEKNGHPASEMFLHLAHEEQESINFDHARAKSTHTSLQVTPFTHQQTPKESRKVLKIAYLSGDFRDHPVAHNLVSLFRLHDRKKFHVTAYSCGPNDNSDYRRRIEQDCDCFVDIKELPDLDAAKRIKKDKIDILIELMGHTRDNRLRLCAFRPAPIQISYLGYPGTTGAEFIDYLIADEIVIPPAHKEFYSEKIIYLPAGFMITDRAPIAPRPSRQTCGLPPEAFIFCSFNNAYKIEPVMFDIWMKILNQTPHSILWLRGGSATMENNLRKEAKKREIDPTRLIFATKVPEKKDHLARLQLADLCLDTRIYNGHTTTLDALWAGVPVITLKGQHFASRVSSSNLKTIKLPELITNDLESFSELAVSLARQPERLKLIKKKLALNRNTTPLFNTEAMARNLETAYQKVWQRYTNNQPTAPIKVET